MGRGDSRKSVKMIRKRSQEKLKERTKRNAVAKKAERRKAKV